MEIAATDAGFSRDAQAWCNTTGNLLISNSEEKGKYTVVIEKGSPKTCEIVTSCNGKAKTLIMFSDDLDKALATFVLANGAAATGQKVSIFFTFWGLNVIKKVAKPKVKKDIFGRMFGMMLPSSSRKLHLSKMSMLGIGDKMMRYIMKQKGIDSLESLRQQALDSGVEFIACQMSMDVMGVKREELLDDVTVGGVATYMGACRKCECEFVCLIIYGEIFSGRSCYDQGCFILKAQDREGRHHEHLQSEIGINIGDSLWDVLKSRVPASGLIYYLSLMREMPIAGKTRFSLRTEKGVRSVSFR